MVTGNKNEGQHNSLLQEMEINKIDKKQQNVTQSTKISTYPSIDFNHL